MKLHVKMYLIAAIGFFIAMFNGQLIDGGRHLLIISPWNKIIILSAILAIAAWFVEGVDIWRSK